MTIDTYFGLALWGAGLISAVLYYARSSRRKRRGQLIRRQVG